MRVRLNQFAKFSCLGIAILALSGIAQASPEFWKGFYTSQQESFGSTTDRLSSSDQNCVAEIVKAEAKYEIPSSLLLAVGIQEAGWRGPQGLTVWPWTVNADGRGKYFKTRDKALAWTKEQMNAGAKSIDVGCMQINLKWHGSAFDNLEDAFSPASNVDYAARFLLSLYQSSGDWTKAAGMYHSRNEGRQTVYLSKLKSNQQYVLTHLEELISLSTDNKVVTASDRPALPSIFWSASLSQGRNASNKAYSIYTSREIQTILPDFSSGEQ